MFHSNQVDIAQQLEAGLKSIRDRMLSVAPMHLQLRLDEIAPLYDLSAALLKELGAPPTAIAPTNHGAPVTINLTQPSEQLPRVLKANDPSAVSSVPNYEHPIQPSVDDKKV